MHESKGTLETLLYLSLLLYVSRAGKVRASYLISSNSRTLTLHRDPPPQETYYDAPRGRDDRGPPPEGGGVVGLGMSVLGVVAIGGLIGVGGVWAWGKFQSGTRQPGVRYMATGPGDNDIGTELGPFGREYA